MTAEEYERITLMISIDAEQRALLDVILEELAGNGTTPPQTVASAPSSK